MHFHRGPTSSNAYTIPSSTLNMIVTASTATGRTAQIGVGAMAMTVTDNAAPSRSVAIQMVLAVDAKRPTM
jgi:hypothetical protein